MKLPEEGLPTVSAVLYHRSEGYQYLWEKYQAGITDTPFAHDITQKEVVQFIRCKLNLSDDEDLPCWEEVIKCLCPRREY